MDSSRACLNGTGIWKWGWKEYYETEVEFDASRGSKNLYGLGRPAEGNSDSRV